MFKSKKIIKSVLKIVGIALLSVVVFCFLLVGLLTVTEYKPKSIENVKINDNVSNPISLNTSYTALSWNIGYGALGDNADFFMDGGTMVTSSTKERVVSNLKDMANVLKSQNPDLIFLQETDLKSKRSHYVNEVAFFQSNLSSYDSNYVPNYKVLYVPYPFPTIGKVNCGLSTFSRFDITQSQRYALPCPFKYPFRLCNLKRALSVNRIPVEGSNKELVMINLHLEAYDSGEGKIAQTKMLKKLLEEETKKGNYVIAAGDFNQSFSNVDISMYPLIGEDFWAPAFIDVNDFDDSLLFVTDNTVPSCRSLDKPYLGSDKSNFQYYLIDGFIVSDNINIEEISTIDLQFVSSDHNPLRLKFKLD